MLNFSHTTMATFRSVVCTMGHSPTSCLRTFRKGVLGPPHKLAQTYNSCTYGAHVPQRCRAFATKRRGVPVSPETVVESGDDGRVRGVKPPPKILITGALGRLGRAVVHVAMQTQPTWHFCLLSSQEPPAMYKRSMLATDRCQFMKVDMTTQVAVPDVPSAGSLGIGQVAGHSTYADQAQQERALWRALKGCTAVLHLGAGVYGGTGHTEGTNTLMDVCFAAGIPHAMYVSLIGCDSIPLSHFRTKHEAEQVVTKGGVPFTLLRVSQLHSELDSMLSHASRVLPLLMPLPRKFKVQSIADEEVAHHIVESLHVGPRGELPDLAGPEILTVEEAAATWKQLRGYRKPTISIPVFGKVGKAFRAGLNTTPTSYGRVPWSSWLKTKVAQEKG